MDAQGAVRAEGNDDDIEHAAFLPWTEEDVAQVALAVIQEALES